MNKIDFIHFACFLLVFCFDLKLHLKQTLSVTETFHLYVRLSVNGFNMLILILYFI